jgi:hypothetical protein
LFAVFVTSQPACRSASRISEWHFRVGIREFERNEPATAKQEYKWRDRPIAVHRVDDRLADEPIERVVAVSDAPAADLGDRVAPPRGRQRVSEAGENSRRSLSSYGDYLGMSLDCADIAIRLLVDYASSHGLPVHIRGGSNTWNSNNTKIHGSAAFGTFCQTDVNANHIIQYNTTSKGSVPASIVNAMAGDLLMRASWDQPQKSFGHTRIFLFQRDDQIHIMQGSGDRRQLDDGTESLAPTAIQSLSLDINDLSGSGLAYTGRHLWWSNAVFGR